ncbi:Ig-like domain-containing protein [Pirellulimonas nuda]|uniref:Ig-like domain-containing protein n=1 Tax=Pirellulimonas nuda TaxID=2528009 RepID=UPI0018D315F5|nr:Ig-like domain-containing protein [Pirellulimonas nuda]
MDQKLEAGRSRRLRHEPLEDRRMLAILIGGGLAGGGDDLESLNGVAPPSGQTIGSDEFVTITNFRVNDADPIDTFRYTAPATGKLIFGANTGSALANLAVAALDSAGNSLTGGLLAPGNTVTFPVVAGRQYFFQAMDILPANGEGSQYGLTIQTVAAPVPASVTLSPASDTGASNSDGVTSLTTPTFFIQDDLATFLANSGSNANVGPIDPAVGAAGYDVQLVATNLATGVQALVNAARVPGSAVWTATTPALTPGTYLVAAQTLVTDTFVAAPGRITATGQLSTPIFVTILPVPNAGVGTIDLLASSDTGVFNNDNVTSTPTPAFTGVGPANDRVRVFAQATNAAGAAVGAPLLVATGVVGSDNTDGTPGDGQGQWQLTTIPIANGLWLFTADFEDAAGTLSAMTPVPGLGVEIDTVAPGLPLLDLTVASDTGRSNTDNITNVTTPVVTLTTFDPPIPATSRLFTDNLRYLVYDRVGTAAEVLLYDSSLDPAVEPTTAPGDIFTSLNFVTTTLPVLAAGDHNLRLEVVDRAGNISQSFLLPTTIDTAAPPISFGLVNTPALPTTLTDGLFDGSDTGVPTNGASYSDRITSDTTPTLWGQAEANAIVSVWLDANGDGIIQTTGATRDIFLGQTTALPLDGNLANPVGYWQVSSAIDLNDLTTINSTGGAFVRDGARPLLVTAQDVAGNPVPAGATGAIGVPAFVAGTTIDALTIFLDTQGPQITAVSANMLPALQGGYDLFDPKPSVNGPTPLVNSITIDFADLPPRVDNAGTANDFLSPALDAAIAATIGNYTVVGDHVGPVVITAAAVNQAIKVSGTVTAPAGNTTTFTAAGFVGAAAANRPAVGDFIVFNNGANTIATRLISNYNVATGAITVDNPYGAAPAIGDGFSIITAASMLHAASIRIFNPPGPLSAVRTAAGANTTTSFGVFASQPGGGSIQVPQVGDYVRFNTGANAGQIRRVTNNPGFDATMTVATAFPFVPNIGDSFTVIAGNLAANINTASVTLTFASALPDDRFTITVSDNLTDSGGNKLDGESNAAQPTDNPVLPSGDGVPGGAFVGRFTIDSRPEIGSYVSQNIAIDINGNGVWDPAAPLGGDASNVDLSFTMDAYISATTPLPGNQSPHELLVAGKFTPLAGVTPGTGLFDQLATYGQYNGQWLWLIDLDSDGAVYDDYNPVTLTSTAANVDPDGADDLIVNQGLFPGFSATARAGALPVAGNFDGNLANGDEIGLYYQGAWFVDTTHNYVLDTVFSTGLLGAPIVGDFDGDGLDDLAVFNSNVFSFNFRNDGFADATDATLIWGLPGVLDQPVAADMNGDGVDDIGLWVPRNSAATAPRVTEWYFLVSTTGAPGAGSLAALNHPFSPPPFGTDLYYEFGDDRALPIVGNFDPPIAAGAVQQQFAEMPGDYDGSGLVDEADRLMWRQYFGTTNPQADGNGDGVVDLSDYTVWRDHLGMSAPLLAGPASAVSAAFEVPGMVADLAAGPGVAGSGVAAPSLAEASTPTPLFWVTPTGRTTGGTTGGTAVIDEAIAGAFSDSDDALLLALATAQPERLDSGYSAVHTAYDGYGDSDDESEEALALAGGAVGAWE